MPIRCRRSPAPPGSCAWRTGTVSSAACIAAGWSTANPSRRPANTRAARAVGAHEFIAALERGYDTLKLEAELFEGIARARTRAGRAENLHFVAAIAEREIAQRTSVFLIAADVADQAGISEPEHAALAEIAAALGVDKDALLGTLQKA